jgi:hypothetical protein
MLASAFCDAAREGDTANLVRMYFSALSGESFTVPGPLRQRNRPRTSLPSLSILEIQALGCAGRSRCRPTYLEPPASSDRCDLHRGQPRMPVGRHRRIERRRLARQVEYLEVTRDAFAIITTQSLILLPAVLPYRLRPSEDPEDIHSGLAASGSRSAS